MRLNELDNAVAHLAEVTELSHVRVALAGVFARQLWGADQLADRIEVLADGAVPEAAPNGVTFQRFVATGDYAQEIDALYAEALDEAVTLETVGREGPDVRMLVLLPEYLTAIAMWDRDDVALETLVRAIDRKTTEDILRQHLGPYAADVFGRRLAEIEWKASRAR
ncbi:MAG: hypothetical protein IPI67_13095 [Myxococcales bacterium]|nr:hypothetical protein [Myxococcales bacterium]